MEKDNILILEDGLRCEILAKTNLNSNNFYLVEQLNEEDEGIGNFAILKEIQENNEIYMAKEENSEVLLEVLKVLTKDFSQIVSEVKVEDLI